MVRRPAVAADLITADLDGATMNPFLYATTPDEWLLALLTAWFWGPPVLVLVALKYGSVCLGRIAAATFLIPLLKWWISYRRSLFARFVVWFLLLTLCPMLISVAVQVGDALIIEMAVGIWVLAVILACTRRRPVTSPTQVP